MTYLSSAGVSPESYDYATRVLEPQAPLNRLLSKPSKIKLHPYMPSSYHLLVNPVEFEHSFLLRCLAGLALAEYVGVLTHVSEQVLLLLTLFSQ